MEKNIRRIDYLLRYLEKLKKTELYVQLIKSISVSTVDNNNNIAKKKNVVELENTIKELIKKENEWHNYTNYKEICIALEKIKPRISTILDIYEYIIN